MVRRWLAAGLVAMTILSAASATSLGVFNSPVATGYAQEMNPCTYDTATVLDGGIPLLTTVLQVTSTITAVQLTGLDGACTELVPIVVVEGRHLVTGDHEVLLVIDQFDALEAGETGGTLTLPLTSHISLSSLVGLYVLTDVRIGFCPAGATCT